MMDDLVSIELPYGRTGRIRLEMLKRQLISHHVAPAGMTNPEEEIRQALEAPLDFPELEQIFVPGDRATIVVDLDTPEADQIFLALWQKMEQAGVSPEDVRILQPAVWKPVAGIDPRRALPRELQERFQLTRHDPTEEGSCAYLASTAGSERVYMSRHVIDADVVVVIGPAEFDPILGMRGTVSSLYPGLSDLQSLQKVKGQGHEELRPEDPRPLRQTVDEIGWLLGLQLAISVIPSGGIGAHEVIVGQCDSVLRKARTRMRKLWDVRMTERAEMVVVSVPQDAAGHSWDQVAAAIDVGRRLVERNGRIVVLTELEQPPGPGLELLKSVREPRDAIKPIRQNQPPDMLVATRIAAATDWANVSLLSKLSQDQVSDLFMIPLQNEREVQRLIETEDSTSIVEAAQHVYAQSGV